MPIERFLLAGKRFEICRNIANLPYAKLQNNKQWVKYGNYGDIKEVQKWKTIGIPEKRLVDIANIFGIPASVFLDESIDDKAFKKIAVDAIQKKAIESEKIPDISDEITIEDGTIKIKERFFYRNKTAVINALLGMALTACFVFITVGGVTHIVGTNQSYETSSAKSKASGRRIFSERVSFHPGSDEIRLEDKEKLRSLSLLFKSHNKKRIGDQPRINLFIETPKEKVELAKKRLLLLKKELIELGITPEKIYLHDLVIHNRKLMYIECFFRK